MQNVIKNKTKKLFKNYYFTQIYLFIYFIFFRNKEKRIKIYLTIKNINIRYGRKNK